MRSVIAAHEADLFARKKRRIEFLAQGYVVSILIGCVRTGPSHLRPKRAGHRKPQCRKCNVPSLAAVHCALHASIGILVSRNTLSSERVSGLVGTCWPVGAVSHSLVMGRPELRFCNMISPPGPRTIWML